MDKIVPFTPDEEKFFNEIASNYFCNISPWHTTTDGIPSILIDIQGTISGRKLGMKRIAVNYYHNRDQYPFIFPLRDFYIKICEDMMGAIKLSGEAGIQ